MIISTSKCSESHDECLMQGGSAMLRLHSIPSQLVENLRYAKPFHSYRSNKPIRGAARLLVSHSYSNGFLLAIWRVRSYQLILDYFIRMFIHKRVSVMVNIPSDEKVFFSERVLHLVSHRPFSPVWVASSLHKFTDMHSLLKCFSARLALC